MSDRTFSNECLKVVALKQRQDTNHDPTLLCPRRGQVRFTPVHPIFRVRIVAKVTQTIQELSLHLYLKSFPGAEAVSCAATQELTNTLWKTKVHYHVYTSPPLVSIIVSQINTVIPRLST